MLLRTLIIILFDFSLVSFSSSVLEDYTDVKPVFEAKTFGGFRVYIPYNQDLTLFALHANINDDIVPRNQGDVHKETKTQQNGYLVLTFDNKLEIGDHVNYWTQILTKNGGYRSNSARWVVTELLQEYGVLGSTCIRSISVINGGTSTCVGDVIIDDEFNGPSINNNLWTVERRIPTYVGPNYEFNSYENTDDTCFFKNNKLFLKPVTSSINNIRGVLDLRQGCTAKTHLECFYESRSVFYLPPIKSARITSKISFKYGKIDIKAKLPAGDWIFPIIQLQPINVDKEHPPRVWIAYSRGNEYLSGLHPLDIDIRMNHDHYDDIGSHLLFAGPVIYSSEPERSKHLVSKREDIPFYDDFHIYSLEWTPDSMVFSKNGVIYGTVKLNQNFALPELGVGSTWKTPGMPFHQEYVLSLGVAVGGQYDFPDNFTSASGIKPWAFGVRTYLKNFCNAQPYWSKTWLDDNVALEIEYVKVTAI